MRSDHIYPYLSL